MSFLLNKNDNCDRLGFILFLLSEHIFFKNKYSFLKTKTRIFVKINTYTLRLG